ncbi:hemolysin [Actibacterium atlanticum]|uniref:Hemolysin n=1 Tax=Actibacterium atlanticum TaxID=1461693 RepID=A0A058ZK70_9RHOB|nr:hemolysin family protein [Actibacterium atlanticum]KCV81963.1 hemolysin [Actibacterium atlanticum]
MGDQTDGSSNAAQSALLETNKRNSGFWSRVSAMFSSTEPQPDLPATTLPPEQPAPGMVNLRRLRVDDVAIPKVEVVAVPEDISKADLVDVFRDSGKSRLPVYDGTLDTPRGFVHLKDFALKYGFNGVGNEFEIAPLLRPLLYVPPSMPIGVLLQKMQTERMHLALVIDEYGGVDGLVSIEDLIEQVVGEIEDEHDVAEGRFWTLEKPGIYLTRARTPLDEFETELGFKLLDGEDEEEIDTLGGLVFMLSGRVPARGEVVQHESGAEFEVVDADPRRIKRLRVRLPADIQKAT